VPNSGYGTRAGCDLVKPKVRDVTYGDQVSKRAMIMQQKTQQPVQFEITEQTRTSTLEWIKKAKLKNVDYLFPSRIHNSLISLPDNMQELLKNGWLALD